MENNVKFTEEQIKEMELFITPYFNTDDNKLDEADEETCNRYKEYVEALCAIDNTIGLRVKAYACYGKGNRVYACDWKASEACLLKLVELDNDFWAANSLGYIYYYGRVNDGSPEYEKAFKYFSVAALYGIHEAIYKVADLCLLGKGMPMRCLEGAQNIMDWLYFQEVKPKFLNGELYGKFADVAARMGRIYLAKALEADSFSDEAYSFYLEARYALQLRAECNFYGDSSVRAGIEKGLNDAKASLSFNELTDEEKEKAAARRLFSLITQSSSVKTKLKVKGKTATFTLSIPKDTIDNGLGLLTVLPEIDYCSFVKKIKVKVSGIRRLKLYTNDVGFLCDDIYETDGWLYFIDVDGKLACKLKADTMSVKRKKLER